MKNQQTNVMENKTRRWLLWPAVCAILFFAVLAVCAPRAAAAWVVDSGSCGKNVSWTFYSDGEMIISGSGKMTNYNDTTVPWSDYRDPEEADYVIKKVTIRSGVTTVGQYAFESCYGVTSVSLPNGLSAIGYAAFAYCTNLKSITIPNGVTGIGDWAFYECYNLVSVKIPNSLTAIGYSAFKWCEALSSISFPNGLVSIQDDAFWGCSKLTSVTIPSTVTQIGESAFGNCVALTKITVASGNPNYYSDGAGCLYNKKKTILMQYPAGNKNKTYSILGTVTEIASYSICVNSYLTNITIPNGVKTIGYYAFAWCEKLASITIPNSVTEIYEGAFSGCTKLTNATLPDGLKTISPSLFEDCNALTFAKIPSSVTTIGGLAFGWCEKLKNVSIPNSVSVIGDGAFYGCKSITEITVSANATAIGAYPFGSCSSLKKITVNSGNPNYPSDSNGCMYDKKKTTLIQYPAGSETAAFAIPNSVLVVADHSFSDCDHLVALTIPRNVVTIESYAIYDCDALEKVEVLNPECKFAENAIVSFYGTLYGYKNSTTQAYAKADDRYFSEIVHNHTYGSELYTQKATMEKNGMTYKICTLCGAKKKVSTIKKIGNVALAKNVYVFNEAVKTPTVIVQDSDGNKLKKNTDYKVKYPSGRKECGTYKIVVTFIGKYSGKKTLKFTIRLGKVTGVKQTSGRGVNLVWNEVVGASWYEVYLYQNGKYSYLLKTTSTDVKNTGLAAGTTVRMKIRAVRVTADGTKIKGPFSADITATAK